MAAPPILQLQNIRLTLGSTRLLDGAELSVSANERICLVGRNGSGKSTLLKLAAGLLSADGGTVFAQPGATIRYMPQEPDMAGFPTTLAYVEAGLGPSDNPYLAQQWLEELGLHGDEDPAHLSGGEARRCALARVLAPAPDLLLLDEPTNHLDLPAIAWLEQALAKTRSAVVLISHDRRLLQTLARAVVWLDGGRTRRLDQGFAAFETWRDEVIAQEEAEQHKLGRQIAREEDWMRYGVTARRKRNMRRVGELAALRARHRGHRARQGGPVLAAADAEISGRMVIDADQISKSFDGHSVVRDLTTRILRRDRLGIVGPNGAGKTTLLRLLTGQLPPDSGTVRLGTELTIVTLDQQRAALDPARTLAETLTGGGGDMVLVGSERRHVIGYMKDFLFSPDQARTPVGVLSGGERGRLLLACALAQPANLLVLDEPTNDLDLETLDLLQEMLAEHPGTIILVSHDRDFLDQVVGSVIVAEGDGIWTDYAGGYSDMLAQQGNRPEAAKTAATAEKPGMVATRPAKTANKAKLSNKDHHALQTLPAEIAKKQAEIAQLQASLDDPKLFAKDQARFLSLGAKLAEEVHALAAAEERWLTLEMLRETLEG